MSAAKISSPLSTYYLVRNPRYTNTGKFVKFSDFLEYGKNQDLSGIMITIEVILPLEVTSTLISSVMLTSQFTNLTLFYSKKRVPSLRNIIYLLICLFLSCIIYLTDVITMYSLIGKEYENHEMYQTCKMSANRTYK